MWQSLVFALLLSAAIEVSLGLGKAMKRSLGNEDSPELLRPQYPSDGDQNTPKKSGCKSRQDSDVDRETSNQDRILYQCENSCRGCSQSRGECFADVSGYSSQLECKTQCASKPAVLPAMALADITMEQHHEVFTRLADGVTATDLTHLANLYTPDAIMETSNATLVGRKEIMAYLKQFMKLKWHAGYPIHKAISSGPYLMFSFQGQAGGYKDEPWLDYRGIMVAKEGKIIMRSFNCNLHKFAMPAKAEYLKRICDCHQ